MSFYNEWFVILTALIAVTHGQREGPSTEEEPWTGRWMPHPPYTESTSQNPVDLHDSKHGVKMGVKSQSCDDAKVCFLVV